MTTTDFDLERFVQAQAPVIDDVRRELAQGKKLSHWMWFVFPQLRDLGHSEMARHYGIGSLAEARAYLAHPILGPRLLACTALANGVAGRSAREVFGTPDDLKFRSSMTLFARAAPEIAAFTAAIDRYYGGAADTATLTLLAG